MALYLRQESDARFTTKGSKLTNEEMDDNWIGLHDLIDALEDMIGLGNGAVNYGVQEMAADDNWNGSSPVIDVDCSANTVSVQLLTADTVIGNRVTILDSRGQANTYNISIITEGSETISGDASKTISTNYGSVTLQVDGQGQWVIISEV